MKFKSLFISFFSLLLAVSALHAQYIPESDTRIYRGKELSDLLYEKLKKEGITARKQQLCRTPENNFPYNLLISIPKTVSEEKPAKAKFSSLVLVFPQDDAVSHLPFIEELIKWNKEVEFNFDVNILLTACDKPQISGNDKMTGTEVYADFNQGSETYCAVYSNLNAQKITTLTPGSAGQVSPLWLTKLVNDSLEANDFDPTIIGSFYISLYKQNLLRSSNTLASFLSRGTPAVELNIKASSADKNSLFLLYQNIITSFDNETDFKEDTHYIPVKLFSAHLWLTENITIILLIVLFTLSLFFICDLGFIFRTRHSIKTISTKRALKTLYLFPATIAVLWICLEIAQFISSAFFNSFMRNPIAVLGIKIAISFILISFAFLIELRFHANKDTYTYEYLLRLSTLLNIFVFSAIDISLFYLFAAIYIIISVSLLFKKTFSIYLFFILSMLPYLQLIFAIATYSTPQQIMPLIFASPLFNILFSCAITPLSILLFRIYLRLKNTNKTKVSQNISVTQIQVKIKKKFPKYYALIQFITVIVFFGLIFLATLYIRNIFRTKINFGNFSGRVIDSPENLFLQAKYNDSSYYGGTIRQLSVNTSRPASRVEIFVSGETDNPVYYTTYTFTPSKNKNQIQFNLPDYPPENIVLNYTPDNSEVTIIDIYAYYDREYYPEEFITDTSNSKRKVFVKEKISLVINSKLKSQDSI